LTSILKPYIWLACIVGFAILLSGCNDRKPDKQAFNYLEKAAKEEEGFNKEQKPLLKEEKKEQSLYNKIMALDTKDAKKIKSYSDEALSSLDKRQKMIDDENKSLTSAYKTFKKAVPYMKEIKKEKAAKSVQQLIDNMKKRYTAFQSLYKSYQSSITADKKLFTLLKDKNVKTEDLQKQLQTVNQTYQKIEENKKAFNAYTETFNDEKQVFYKIIGMADGQ